VPNLCDGAKVMTDIFKHTFRVRYAEVDPQAVVFNSRYLEYADILVTEYFRDRKAYGMPNDLEFHVRKAVVNFIEPIRVDELIEGSISIPRIGNTSMEQLIVLHGSGDQTLRAEIILTAVLVDLASGSPIPIPEAARIAFGHPSKESKSG
jgi:acyl-CoA thioester hydrolase